MTAAPYQSKVVPTLNHRGPITRDPAKAASGVLSAVRSAALGHAVLQPQRTCVQLSLFSPSSFASVR